MTMQDPIADMLTRIRNAQQVMKRSVEIPYSSAKLAIVEVLKKEGYVLGYEKKMEGKRKIVIKLKYNKENGTPVINYIHRISRPGLRVYRRFEDLSKVMNGFGIVVISTSRGVMSDKEARAGRCGGEVICEVY